MTIVEWTIVVAMLSALIAGYGVGYLRGEAKAISDVEGMCAVAAEIARAGERDRVNAKWRDAVQRSYVEMQTKIEDLP